MAQGHVVHRIENQIGIIEFGHPRSNSLPGNILNKLALTITELESISRKNRPAILWSLVIIASVC